MSRFVLYLNPMAGRCENADPIAIGERDALERFVAGERVEPYQDGNWRKVFRQGGPLEWYNPPEDVGGFGPHGAYQAFPLLEDELARIAQQVTADYHSFVGRLRHVI